MLKNKLIILLAGLIFWGCKSAKVYSQVAINIAPTSAKGVFHIDPKGDTSGSTNIADDVVISSNGFMGIGTDNPTANLDIRGTLQIKTGKEFTDYVMTSDANGKGDWSQYVFANRRVGTIGAMPSVPATGGANAKLKYMNVSITLPAGSWMIFFTARHAYVSGVNYNIWWDLMKTYNGGVWNVTNQAGRVLSYASYGVYGTFGSVSYCSYTVAPTTTTTYYLFAGTHNGSAAIPYSSGARIWALPTN